MHLDWQNLGWLESYKGNIREECATLTYDNPASIQNIANKRLTDAQLNKLAKTVAAFPETPKGFERFSLGIIGNANSDYLKQAIIASGLRHRMFLDVVVEGMGQTVTAVLNEQSEINKKALDAVLIAYTHHVFPRTVQYGDSASAGRIVEQLIEEINLISEKLFEIHGTKTLLQTIPHSPQSIMGSMEHRVEGSLNYLISLYNHKILELGYPVIDIAALAQNVGICSWHDPAQWYWTKAPFSQIYIPLYADFVARFIGALRGKSKKCMVLDLDNTLWGGVIGDDGLDGIELGQGTPIGEAYQAIQQMALNYRARGIVLAVCSKNDEINAKLPFQQHPEQVLKEEHVAVFQANWEDKASNLEAIAKALSLTNDALVFLDDNPAEREIIRRELPDVAVPEIPDKEPALWPDIISAAGYFEMTNFTSGDVKRAEQYAANVQREKLKVKSRDIEDYLQSLDMVLSITSFVPVERARITQLINRSNQFNLTTRRYTEEEVEKFENDPSVHCFSARLEDRFGDNGIISIVICKEQNNDWVIDTWLMSCRVLGRKVEFALINEIAGCCKKAGKERLIGEYIPTEKNGMVEKHYGDLGFVLDKKSDGGRSSWHLSVRDYKEFSVPIRIDTGKECKKRA